MRRDEQSENNALRHQLEGGLDASRFLRQFEEERTKLWRAMGRRLDLNDETLSLSGGTLPERLTQLRDMMIKPKPVPTMLGPILGRQGGTGRPLLGAGTGGPEAYRAVEEPAATARAPRGGDSRGVGFGPYRLQAAHPVPMSRSGGFSSAALRVSARGGAAPRG